MKSIDYDVSKMGFEAVFKPWQLMAIRFVWKSPVGVNSRTVYEGVNQMLGDDSISRASIINFLEDLREMEILRGVDETGKGGHHWVYSPAVDEEGLKKFIVETLVNKLVRDFPDETRKVLAN
jgi:hypothetical protein